MPQPAYMLARTALSQATTSPPTSVNSAASPLHLVSGQRPRHCSVNLCLISGPVVWPSAISLLLLVKVNSEWLRSLRIIPLSQQATTSPASSNSTASFLHPTAQVRLLPELRPILVAQPRIRHLLRPQRCRPPPTMLHVHACRTL